MKKLVLVARKGEISDIRANTCVLLREEVSIERHVTLIAQGDRDNIGLTKSDGVAEGEVCL